MEILESNSLPSRVKQYKVLNALGKGSFGLVHKVEYNLKQYAAKFIQVDMNETLSNIFREASLLQELNHKNIVKIHCSFLEEIYFIIIMELCEGGNLQRFIGKLSQNTIEKTMIQIAQGIKYLHKRNIIHRDLKPANIFLNNQNTIKIGDFGLAKVVDSMAQTRCGTSLYMAPQIHSMDYNREVDIWSLGIIFIELMTGQLIKNLCLRPPYLLAEFPTEKIKSKITNKMWLNLIIQMTLKDPKDRITIEGVLEILTKKINSPNFIKSISNCEGSKSINNQSSTGRSINSSNHPFTQYFQKINISNTQKEKNNVTCSLIGLKNCQQSQLLNQSSNVNTTLKNSENFKDYLLKDQKDIKRSLDKYDKDYEELKKKLGPLLEQLKFLQDEKIKNYTSLFFLGDTGCGKSSFISYLLGAAFDYKFDGRLYKLSHNMKEKYPQIGNIETQSCTSVPSIYFHKKQIYYDPAGFFDTKGVLQQVLNCYSNSKMFRKGSHAKIIMMVEESTLYTGRGHGFVEVVNQLATLLNSIFQKDFQNIANSCFLVISKVNYIMESANVSSNSSNQQKLLNNAADRLTKLIASLSQNNHNLYSESSILLRNIIKFNRILIFPTPELLNSNEIENIKNKFESIKAVTIEKQPVPNLTDDADQFMKRITHHIVTKINQIYKMLIEIIDSQFYLTPPFRKVEIENKLNKITTIRHILNKNNTSKNYQCLSSDTYGVSSSNISQEEVFTNQIFTNQKLENKKQRLKYLQLFQSIVKEANLNIQICKKMKEYYEELQLCYSLGVNEKLIFDFQNQLQSNLNINEKIIQMKLMEINKAEEKENLKKSFQKQKLRLIEQYQKQKRIEEEKAKKQEKQRKKQEQQRKQDQENQKKQRERKFQKEKKQEFDKLLKYFQEEAKKQAKKNEEQKIKETRKFEEEKRNLEKQLQKKRKLLETELQRQQKQKQVKKNEEQRIKNEKRKQEEKKKIEQDKKNLQKQFERKKKIFEAELQRQQRQKQKERKRISEAYERQCLMQKKKQQQRQIQFERQKKEQEEIQRKAQEEAIRIQQINQQNAANQQRAKRMAQQKKRKARAAQQAAQHNQMMMRRR